MSRFVSSDRENLSSVVRAPPIISAEAASARWVMKVRIWSLVKLHHRGCLLLIASCPKGIMSRSGQHPGIPNPWNFFQAAKDFTMEPRSSHTSAVNRTVLAWR